MNLPEIFVCARRAPVASAVVSVYFAEFVEASRARAKREADDFLAAAERRANARRFAPQPAMPSAFAQLEQA